MEKHLSFIATEFGFTGFGQLRDSLIRPQLLNITVPVAVIGSSIEYLFGLQLIVFIAFIALLTLELVTGIFAAWIEGQKITSKRMKAFLMMLFVWLVVLFILNIFKLCYKETKLEPVFEYLFNAVILFVNAIYFKSIWENVGRIMGKKNEFKKLGSIFGKQISEDDK